MTLSELRDFPTTISTGVNGVRIHESVLRSYQLVRKIEELLAIPGEVPAGVLLEIISDVMNAPGKDREFER